MAVKQGFIFCHNNEIITLHFEVRSLDILEFEIEVSSNGRESNV